MADPTSTEHSTPGVTSSGTASAGGTARDISTPGATAPASDRPAAGTERSIVHRGGESPLSGRGTTTIADSVVTKVAGIAASEVPGVHRLGGGAARALGTVTQRVGIGDPRTQGVTVEVGERQAAVDLVVVVEYGESIPSITRQVRDQVIKRIETLVGLEVTEVNIAVDDLYFPGDDVPAEPEPARVA